MTVKFDNLMVSVVPAPLCTACRESMVAYDSWRWVCRYPKCVNKDQPQHLRDVYPLIPVGETK